MKYPNMIKELRNREGLTQQELADEIGVVREAIKNWEGGTRPMKSDVIIKLANFFHVSTDYLLCYKKKHHWVKSCPLCDEHETIDFGERSEKNRRLYYVECKNCGVTIQSVVSLENAIKRWNRRA